jgi:hypothetical protein
MIKVRFDNKKFNKQMKNIVDYSTGFTEGIQNGKSEFLKLLGADVSEIASQFIDTNARVSPSTLHHVYEWYKNGSPEARLFDIDYTVSNIGLSFISNFKQSSTVSRGSTEPFRNKADIMENGTRVVIRPRFADALRFEVDGEVVYTKKPVVVENPGGNTQGEFEKAFDMFFGRYFTQAFLQNSNLKKYFENPIVYKKNLRKGMRGGRSTGLSTGYRWVVNAKVAG